MNRDDWHAILASEPATPRQRGALMREFGRLGYRDCDRAERLAAAANLLGIANLDSVHDLLMGQAGYLLHVLPEFPDRAALEAELAPLPPAPPAQPSPPSRLSTLPHEFLAAYLAWRRLDADLGPLAGRPTSAGQCQNR